MDTEGTGWEIHYSPFTIHYLTLSIRTRLANKG